MADYLNPPPGSTITIEHPNGKRIVIHKKTKIELLRANYPTLVNNPITVTDAAQKYNVHKNTIIEWKKNGYLPVLKSGYRMELDEASVAYCAGIYHRRKKTGIGFGAPLLDEYGLEYQLKHPQLAKYRLKKRTA